jgi:ribosome biogenesis GTPase
LIVEKIGKVVKGLGGLYEVRVIDKDSVERILCRAKGALHRDDEKIVIGDNVRVTIDSDSPDSIVISEILERKNSLIRPPVSNLDYLFIVFSPRKPSPVLETVDKLVAIAEHNGIIPVIVISKSELDDTLADEYYEIYNKIGIDTFITSAFLSKGTDGLREYIKNNLRDGKTAAFAGASGVGKSTLMNTLFEGLALATSEISKKIDRGRHTTRHVEIFDIDGSISTGFLADTLGFSLVDFARFDFFSIEDLEPAFREFKSYRGACRYADCAHVGEGKEECAVIRAGIEGEIPASRLLSYQEIYKVLKAKNPYA